MTQRKSRKSGADMQTKRGRVFSSLPPARTADAHAHHLASATSSLLGRPDFLTVPTVAWCSCWYFEPAGGALRVTRGGLVDCLRYCRSSPVRPPEVNYRRRRAPGRWSVRLEVLIPYPIGMRLEIMGGLVYDFFSFVGVLSGTDRPKWSLETRYEKT